MEKEEFKKNIDKYNNASMHFRISEIINNLTKQEHLDLINYLWGYGRINNFKMIDILKFIIKESRGDNTILEEIEG